MTRERMFSIYETDKAFKRRMRRDKEVYSFKSEVNRHIDYAATDDEIALMYKGYAIRIGIEIAGELREVIEEVLALRRNGFCLANNRRKRQKKGVRQNE